ncbi:MAG: hypothetical protein ACI4PV_08625 [Butyricicoccus sp.]
MKRIVKELRDSSRKIREQYNPAASRSLHLTGMSGAANLLLGLGKIISGVLSLSIFVCVNGCYTLGMVMARYCALAGVLKGRDQKTQIRHYQWSGIILILASLLYMAYSGWLYFHPKQAAYHEYIALAIATVTFTEIGLNLRGVLLFRKSATPLLHAIKTINLAASLISLVLTQSAILSFVEEGDHNPAWNAALGVLMSGCAILLGFYMLSRIKRMTDETDCRRELRKLRRLAKHCRLSFSITPVRKELVDGETERVIIKTDAPPQTEQWTQLKEAAMFRYHFDLFLLSESCEQDKI